MANAYLKVVISVFFNHYNWNCDLLLIQLCMKKEKIIYDLLIDALFLVLTNGGWDPWVMKALISSCNLSETDEWWSKHQQWRIEKLKLIGLLNRPKDQYVLEHASLAFLNHMDYIAQNRQERWYSNASCHQDEILVPKHISNQSHELKTYPATSINQLVAREIYNQSENLHQVVGWLIHDHMGLPHMLSCIHIATQSHPYSSPIHRWWCSSVFSPCVKYFYENRHVVLPSISTSMRSRSSLFHIEEVVAARLPCSSSSPATGPTSTPPTLGTS